MSSTVQPAYCVVLLGHFKIKQYTVVLHKYLFKRAFFVHTMYGTAKTMCTTV